MAVGVSDDFEEGLFEVGFVMSGNEFFGGAAFYDFAVGHDEDLLAHSVDFEHVVAGQEDGGVAALLVAKEVVPNPGGCIGVEAGGGFVQEEEFGFVDEGFGQGDPGFLSGGEFAELFVEEFFEFEVFGQLFDAAFCIFDFVEFGIDLEVFPYGESLGEVNVGAGHVDPREDLEAMSQEVFSKDVDASGCGQKQAKEHGDGGGLASTVAAQEGGGAMGLQIKGEVVDCCEVAEFFGQFFDLNNGSFVSHAGR